MKHHQPAFSVLMLLAAALLALAVLALLPSPLVVETAPAPAAGPLTVSIDEEARTSARDRYTVAAPTAGRLERVALRAGAAVARGQELAVLRLAPLDVREREAAEGRLRAAEALRREAVENLESSVRKADAAQAARDRERARNSCIRRATARCRSSSRRGTPRPRPSARAPKPHASASRRPLPRWPSRGPRCSRARAAPARTAGASCCAPPSTAGCCGCSSRASACSPPGRRSSRSATLRGSRSSSRCSRPDRGAGAPRDAGEPRGLGRGGDASRDRAHRGAGGLHQGFRARGRGAARQGDRRPGRPPRHAGRRLPGRGPHSHLVVGCGAQGAGERGLPTRRGFRGGSRRDPRLGGLRGPCGPRAPAIVPGHRTPAEVEIVEGIAAGERVVLHPPNELRDGAKVGNR